MNLMPNPKHLRKYLFEIIVIFVGITLGFLFDEWRDGREEKRQRIALNESMKRELLRIQIFFLSEDSAIQNQLIMVNDYLGNKRADTSVLYLGFELIREVSFLQGTFSHVNALANDNANRITSNVTVAENLTYISNMENDLARMKGDTRDIILKSIWPAFVKHQIDKDIYTLAVNGKLTLTGDYKSFTRDPNIDGDLRLLAIKLNWLSGLDKGLIERIEDVLAEVKKD